MRALESLSGRAEIQKASLGRWWAMKVAKVRVARMKCPASSPSVERNSFSSFSFPIVS